MKISTKVFLFAVLGVAIVGAEAFVISHTIKAAFPVLVRPKGPIARY